MARNRDIGKPGVRYVPPAPEEDVDWSTDSEAETLVMGPLAVAQVPVPSIGEAQLKPKAALRDDRDDQMVPKEHELTTAQVDPQNLETEDDQKMLKEDDQKMLKEDEMSKDDV